MTRPTLSDAQPPRDKWRVELVDQKTESGLVLFEYAVREPTKDPFLLNNHKAQIRTNHHRVITGPKGGLMHVSGIEVLDVEEFEKGKEFYRWADKDKSGAWRDEQGRTLAPFIFPAAPWAGGADEELDPQWQRETFVLDEASQIQECIDRYQERMSVKGYIGDKRGTTLNLQVGASADDADQLTSDAVSITRTSQDSDAATEHLAFRFTGLTIAAGSTIDNAIFTVKIPSSVWDNPNHQLRGELNASAAQFTTTSNDIDGRSRTTATINWNVSDVSGIAADQWQQWGATTSGGAGTSIASIVQEVVNLGGWASGNPLALIAEQPSTNGTRDLQVYFYDNSSATAAKLDIDYTAGGGGGAGGALAGGKLAGGFLAGGRLAH